METRNVTVVKDEIVYTPDIMKKVSNSNNKVYTKANRLIKRKFEFTKKKNYQNITQDLQHPRFKLFFLR